MLFYFPQVRDEESTYSIFARMQFALQPPNYEVMGKILFNKTSEVGRLNFQGSFDYLCSNLPSNFTSEKFFYNNTIYPLFVPFISTERQEKALEYFKGSYPGKINKYLAMSSINKTRTYIRICKECVKEDFKKYGEPYYRRHHEIELNRMCYKHKIPLYEYVIPNYIIPRKYDDYYTVLSNSKELVIPKEFREKFLNIATDINYIFTSNLENWNIKITKDKILNRLKENGHLAVTGSRLKQIFKQDFKQYYTEEFLDYIGYNFNANAHYIWVNSITTNQFVADPLKYILLIRYLFGSFEEFYQYNSKYSLFKPGPYPCLNKLCPNYNKLVIKDIMKITCSDGYPTAAFKCEHCGFKYNRKGPDKNDDDIYKKTYVRIKERGHLWHNKLKKCVNKDFTIHEISKILDCKRSKDLIYWINKYKNTSLIKTSSVIEAKIEFDNLFIEQYKNEVLNLLEKNPGANRLDICRLNPKAYKYLSENDSKWILSNIQFNKKNKSISKDERIRDYWLKKDSLISNDLLNAVSKIKLEKTPHKRITVYLLQQYTGHDNLNRNRFRLPKCSEVLDKVCETLLDYQKRRVNYVMKEMADNNIKVTVARVSYKANLNKLNLETGKNSNTNREILDYVKEKVKVFNHGNI